MENIDHIVHNVVFKCLVLTIYGNSSISSTSFFKSMAFSYFHANVIYTMGITIIIGNIKGGLIKQHVEFIKKCCFLWLEIFL